MVKFGLGLSWHLSLKIGRENFVHSNFCFFFSFVPSLFHFSVSNLCWIVSLFIKMSFYFSLFLSSFTIVY
jgi:hypothetical protein